MVPFAYRSFRDQARSAVKSSCDSPHKLTALHVIITLGVGFLISLLTYFLNRGIAGSGGLGGIDRRTTLEFFQSMLRLISLIFLPFWSMGYLSAVLHLARGQDISRRDLLQGFRQWGNILRTLLMQGMILFCTGYLGAQVGSTLFLLTPSAQELLLLTEQMMEQGMSNMSEMMQDATYMRAMMPMIPWMVVGALALGVPAFYRTRFMRHVALDHPERGGFFAMVCSFRMSKRRFWPLVLLDLRLWWYHGLQLLALAIGCLDLLLPKLGISLSADPLVLALGCYGLSLLLRLAICTWKKAEVFSLYALVYDHIRTNDVPVTPKVPRPAKQVPWKY